MGKHCGKEANSVSVVLGFASINTPGCDPLQIFVSTVSSTSAQKHVYTSWISGCLRPPHSCPSSSLLFPPSFVSPLQFSPHILLSTMMGVQKNRAYPFTIFPCILNTSHVDSTRCVHSNQYFTAPLQPDSTHYAHVSNRLR